MPIFSIVVARMAPAGAVELGVHQMLAEMDHVDFAAMVHQAPRRLQPEQAATDHGGFLAALGRLLDAGAVVDGAEAEHAGPQIALGIHGALQSAE